MAIDPFRNFRYRVEINGIITAAFSSVTIPDTSTDAIDYREGTDPIYTRKLGGLTKYGTITLNKGVTNSTELYLWRKTVETAGVAAARKHVSLIMLDDIGMDCARWDIFNAWPSRYNNSYLDAKASDVAIETLELTLEYM